MKNTEERLMGIKKAMHLISFLGYPFLIAGLVYLIMFFFFSSPENRIRDLSLALLFMGFVMAFASMGDIDSMTDKEKRKIIKNREWQYLRFILGIGGFVFSLILGLFFTFMVKDYAQGFAITAFGVGGLALQKYQLDAVLAVLVSENNDLPDEGPEKSDTIEDN